MFPPISPMCAGPDSKGGGREMRSPALCDSYGGEVHAQHLPFPHAMGRLSQQGEAQLWGGLLIAGQPARHHEGAPPPPPVTTGPQHEQRESGGIPSPIGQAELPYHWTPLLVLPPARNTQGHGGSLAPGRLLTPQ